MKLSAPTRPPVQHPLPSTGRFLVALALGLVAIAAVNLAVRHGELVTGRYVTGGAPPVAACGVLLALLALRGTWRRCFGTDLTRDQLLLIYSMVALGTFLAGGFALRVFLPHTLALQYWSKTRPELAPFVAYVPSWFAPTDPEAIRRYFEGSPGGEVPWALWLRPMAVWSSFWMALFGAGWCLLLLFRRQWFQSERLSFPLLTLPLALTSPGEQARFGDRPVLRNGLLWMGVGASALFNGLNIWHALSPSVPAPGFYLGLSAYFTEPSLRPLRSIVLFFMPEAIGFGYFVPLDISFSLWFFYLLEKAFAVFLLASGRDLPGVPFMQEQSAGAYLFVGALLVANSRRHLVRLWRGAFLQPWQRATAEEREARGAWLGLAASALFLLGFVIHAGIPLRVALPFLAILACWMLVFARLRAETGVPFEQIHVFRLPKDVLVETLSVPGILQAGGPRAMAMLSAFGWLSQAPSGHLIAAHQVDALKLAEVARVARRRLWLALGAAFAFGLAGAWWSHLSVYYQLGSNVAGGGPQGGGWIAAIALREYGVMAGQVASPPEPALTRLGMVAAGGGVALALAALRNVWFASPFHPLGYLLATSCGDINYMFFPLFVAWLLKGLLLRAGGLRLYGAGLPFFLGLILGHFMLAGVLWPLLSLIISPEAAAAYQPHFG